MTSKFQKRPFPVEKLAKFQSITATCNNGQQIVEIAYQDLKLCVQNNQLCWYYESEDGDLIMPIARKSTIDNLFNED